MPDEGPSYPAEVVEAAQKFDYQQKGQEAKQENFAKSLEKELPLDTWVVTSMREEFLKQPGHEKERSRYWDVTAPLPEGQKVGIEQSLKELARDLKPYITERAPVFEPQDPNLPRLAVRVDNYRQALEEAQTAVVRETSGLNRIVRVVNYQDHNYWNAESGFQDRQFILIMNPEDYKRESTFLEKYVFAGKVLSENKELSTKVSNLVEERIQALGNPETSGEILRRLDVNITNPEVKDLVYDETRDPNTRIEIGLEHQQLRDLQQRLNRSPQSVSLKELIGIADKEYRRTQILGEQEAMQNGGIRRGNTVPLQNAWREVAALKRDLTKIESSLPV